MSMIYKLFRYLCDENYRFLINANFGIYNQMNDKEYLERVYKAVMGREIDFSNPVSFNEKLQWLKVYDHNPKYTMLVDKYEVKNYVSSIIGDEYIIPTLGVWEKFDDIDFERLPNMFVLKCTHDSGGVVICKDKNNFDVKAAKKQLDKCLNKNFFYQWREWPYKNVKPRMIAEPYVEDESGELRDYKLMMFNGVHKCSFTCTERFSNTGLKVTFFDTDWNVMPFERHYHKSGNFIEKPISYKEMQSLAVKLSKGIPFVRVDFYEINGRPYFGELTFYPGSGFEEFNPGEWDYILGDWLDLSSVKNR